MLGRLEASLTKKKPLHIQMHISEESLEDRYQRFRGFGCIPQMQGMYVFTKNTLKVNRHDRLYAPGTNRGTVIGPLGCDALDDTLNTWVMKVKDKFVLYGRHGPRIPVGGSLELEQDEDAGLPAAGAEPPRDKESEEAFMYHTAPKKLFEELIHAFDAVAVISLAADGKAAMSALERGIPFFGWTMTPEHGMWLRERLKGVVFKKFQDPQSKLHKAGLTALLARCGTVAAVEAGTPAGTEG